MKEAEMKEHAKIQQREIAKKRLAADYKRDKMEAISSADYEPAEELTTKKEGSSPTKTSFTDELNKSDVSDKPKVTPKNSFQQMLAESEMKVSVAKKAPKKGM
jgi:hypothetical protein